MIINWYGQSCFQISSSQGKDNHFSIVIDPFGEDIGLKLPRKLEADIVLVSRDHPDHNNVKAVSGPPKFSSEKLGRAGQPLIIKGPGEYEIKEVFIRGIPGFYDNSQGAKSGDTTIYTIETEGIRICHLGNLGQKELSPVQLDKTGEVDILMIPVGGIYTIDAGEAIKIMAQIEPKITIPMHYRVPNLKIHPVKSSEAGAKQFNGVKLEGVDKFLKALGIKSLESLPRLLIKEKDISSEEAKIILLKP
jgi:L-ascorbate metabolism protein UlaG (beta-lactamase superfamily)